MRSRAGVVALLLGSPLALWTILLLAVPRQDFPLNDDWAYARGAIAFARGEGIHYFHWAGIPLLGQWLWSKPFLALFGASNIVLRLSTVMLSELAVLAFFDLLRSEGLATTRAAFAAAVLAVNPLFFLLAGTYMSDVPALSFSLLALAAYARAFARGSPAVLVAAAAAATLASATRQNALAAPAAAGLLLLTKPALRKQIGWLLAVGAPVATGLVVAVWFRAHGDGLARGPQWPALDATFFRAFAFAHLVALSVLPLIALDPALGSRRSLLAVGVLAMGIGVWQLAGGTRFPYLGNTLTAWGAFASESLIPGERPLVMGRGARLAATIAGCGAAGWLLARLARATSRGARPRLLAAFTLLQAVGLAVSPVAFDRYALPLLPGAIGAAAWPSGARPHRVAGACLLLLFAASSLALMHDWLSWNAARWALGRRALARGIGAQEIEGGIEWDGWFSSGGPWRTAGPHGLVLPFNARFFGDAPVPYALAFSQPAGTTRVDAEPYCSWLPPRAGEFLLVESAAGQGAIPAGGGKPAGQ